MMHGGNLKLVYYFVSAREGSEALYTNEDTRRERGAAVNKKNNGLP